MTRLAASLSLLCISVLVMACADKPLAPIEDREIGGTSKVEQRYTVLRGDTLFSIAFRYGLDFRRLAAANAISAPYTIYPGQKLRLAEVDPRPVFTPTAKVLPSVVARAAVKAPEPSAQTSATRPLTNQNPGANNGSRGTKPLSAPKAGAAPKPSPPVRKANSNVAAWRWPVAGKVTRRFEANLHKGLDISGERGDPVLATAGGSVVYAGTGIAGYGLMLIVRHNDEYLSAYGHNESLLVGEGDIIRGGQKIAERGSSGTDSVKLHFEIRRRGRPVDPLQLLPRR